MRWHKRGLFFNPHEHPLPPGCTSFAQSPQALVCDGYIRIYFSTRARDASGQFLSHVGYVDTDPTVRRILRTSTNPVLPLGQLGSFDEHGIFPMHVMRAGHDIHAFTCGWSRRISVPVETAIGHAISRDGGDTFERRGPGPVMGPTPEEPFLVGDPFVIHRDDGWHMWYIHGTRWVDSPGDPGPARVYKIAYASSRDSEQWVRGARGIIADTLGPDECQALPTVMHAGGRWHMYFCYRHATDFRTNASRGYRLGYAWSDDLRQWHRDDAASGFEMSPSGWDADMVCYPHVFECDGRHYLLYNGNAFGRDGFGVAELEP